MKNIILGVCLIMFGLVGCQKDTVDARSDKGEEIKKLEDMYGVQFKKISEEEAKNSVYIPFDILKEYLEDNSNLLSRSGGLPFQSVAMWLREQDIEIKVRNFKIRYSFPFAVDLRFYFTKDIEFSACFEAKDLMIDCLNSFSRCILYRESNTFNATAMWHEIDASFRINLSTVDDDGKWYGVEGVLQMNTRIDMGKDMHPIKTPFTLGVRLWMTF